MDSETAEEIKRNFDVVGEGLRELRTEIREGLHEVRTELRTEIQEGLRELRTEIREGLHEVRTELRTEIREVRQHSDVVAESLRTELRAEIRDVKRHSDVIAESLRGEIRLVTEGVTGLDEKFTLEFKNVREEIGEVKSLLRLSYGDLDRRVQSLEKSKPS